MSKDVGRPSSQQGHRCRRTVPGHTVHHWWTNEPGVPRLVWTDEQADKVPLATRGPAAPKGPADPKGPAAPKGPEENRDQGSALSQACRGP
jgi:hypothetical protein